MDCIPVAALDFVFLIKKPSKIFVFEGWKGQNPSTTFRFEGCFVENLQKPSTWRL